MKLLAAVATGRYQVGCLEHAQVLHHAEAGHLWQKGLQLVERLAVALEQPVEEKPPFTVSKRLENLLHPAGHNT
jgi:hypothetical protein